LAVFSERSFGLAACNSTSKPDASRPKSYLKGYEVAAEVWTQVGGSPAGRKKQILLKCRVACRNLSTQPQRNMHIHPSVLHPQSVVMVRAARQREEALKGAWCVCVCINVCHSQAVTGARKCSASGSCFAIRWRRESLCLVW
jgi:hypothetical protein